MVRVDVLSACVADCAVVLGRFFVTFSIRALFVTQVVFLTLGPLVVSGLLAWVVILSTRNPGMYHGLLLLKLLRDIDDLRRIGEYFPPYDEVSSPSCRYCDQLGEVPCRSPDHHWS